MFALQFYYLVNISMTQFQLKEANRYYWIVKGQLIPESWSEEDIMKTHDSYFARIWGNHEAQVHAIGFEAAWKEREAKILLDKKR